jgi:hypothetical protein
MALKNFNKAARKKTALAEALDKLAASIVADVSQLDLEVKLLAMRTLTQYYSATTRAGDGDNAGLGFDTFREKLAASNTSGRGNSGDGTASTNLDSSEGPDLSDLTPDNIIHLATRASASSTPTSEGGET